MNGQLAVHVGHQARGSARHRLSTPSAWDRFRQPGHNVDN
ncbi:hypothetical protein C4K27_0345 [Pseudomonas chlororaphis subsp. chlororaphis]|nr:hypothetical protein C4K27_0345 [Pseudomonas chlororaphis subsp. chlororaphis]